MLGHENHEQGDGEALGEPRLGHWAALAGLSGMAYRLGLPGIAAPHVVASAGGGDVAHVGERPSAAPSLESTRDRVRESEKGDLFPH